MGRFTNKKGVIMGVANNKSIATAVAKTLASEGAELAFSFLPDDTGRMEKRVQQAIEGIDRSLLAPCDIKDDAQIKSFFEQVHHNMGDIDFLVHSIAFASIDELRRPTLEVSRQGFLEAIDASAYSILACSREAAAIMNEEGSILGMTYFGGEKVIPGYNIMGVCKATLDHTIRYLAYDLGQRRIRVNAISAGPIRTLASSAVGDFKDMLKLNAAMSPLGRNVTQEDVGHTASFLLSPHAAAITGDIIHVDSGYHVMGAITPNAKELIKGS